jgi:hypothetical protein
MWPKNIGLIYLNTKIEEKERNKKVRKKTKTIRILIITYTYCPDYGCTVVATDETIALP